MKQAELVAPPVPSGVQTSGSIRAWYAVAMLTVLYIVSYIDRQILNLLIEPIKADLSLSDTQVSLLQGLAFALFYSLLGVPVGRLADEHNRCRIITIGLVLWSIMTALCGFARNFTQLFLARVGVGVGESTLHPAAYSIIGDYFTNRNLNTALSVYTMGAYIGSGLALVIGGGVIQWVSNSNGFSVPFVEAVRPWQAAFLVVGLPGLLVAALFLTVAEPTRREHLSVVAQGTPDHQRASVRATLSFILRNARACLSHFFGFALHALVTYGALAWLPSLFIRVHEWPAPQAGYAVGIAIIVMGPLGLYFGGRLADKLVMKGRRDTAIIAGMVGAAGLLPSITMAATAHTASTALIAAGAAAFFMASPFGAAAAGLQVLVPNHMRAQISAVYLLIVNLIGLGLGPTSIALATDYVFGDTRAVGSSLALVSTVVLTIGLLIFAWGRPAFQRQTA
jgi:MFS family permease